jgi:small GTP-binding protein
MSEDAHYKVVMLGDSGVGKTALVNRISEGVFTDSHVPTVGSQFIALPLEINKRKMTLELWDTAGQEVTARLSASTRGRRRADSSCAM